MTRKNRPGEDRQMSLEPVPPQANLTIAGVRPRYEGMGGKEFCCTISGYWPNANLRVSKDRLPTERRRTSPHHLFVFPGSSVCRYRSGGLLREIDERKALCHQS